jgi:hypothetical protein
VFDNQNQVITIASNEEPIDQHLLALPKSHCTNQAYQEIGQHQGLTITPFPITDFLRQPKIASITTLGKSDRHGLMMS